MGRPKGSKTKDQLDPGSILSTSRNGRKVVAPAESPEPPPSKVERTTRKNFRDCNYWKSKIGTPIESIPPTKLPKNKVILQRFIDLRHKNPKVKVSVLVCMLYDEVSAIWSKARIPVKEELQCKLKI